MEKNSDKQVIYNLINVYLEIFEKSKYIITRDSKSLDFDVSFEKGCQFAYTRCLEAIKDYFVANDWDFDGNIIDEYKNPYTPLSFKPKNFTEQW